MVNKIVLVLMQLKGINRKTILKNFSLTSGMDCNVDNIINIVQKAGVVDKRIKPFSVEEIEKAIKETDEIIEKSAKQDIKIVTYLDKEYPQRLKNITDPPTVLYYKGDISCFNRMNAVAIIGTREPTEYGIKIARHLGSSFGKSDYIVVSGLALGCDSFGHEGCLNEGGKTFAIMPCGLDEIYPAKNKHLAKQILEKGGGLISEYPINTRAYKNLFVERDRLQSGLCDGVVVVETGETGGTLHTVEYALEYKRVVACYSHPEKYLKETITYGNQKLIKEGKAFPINNDESLFKFRKKMENGEEYSDNMKGIQRTIFDYISD